MEKQQVGENRHDAREQHFTRLKHDYENALKYQFSDRKAALFTARNIAENMCGQLVKQRTAHNPTGLQLDALIGKLISEKALSPNILVPLRAVQYYGNLGVHYQNDKDLQIEYVQACLYSLFGVMNWYFETYWPEGRVTIPFPVSSMNDQDIDRAEHFRRTQKTAILVLMFIDMVNSTALRDDIGEVEFERLRQRKKNVLLQRIEQGHHGKLIKDFGDGYLAVFSVPGIAVETALAMQEELAAEPAYQVRIGVDMGQVTQETEFGMTTDVFGRHVDRAARIQALCEGGHVLTSYPVWDSAEGWLKHHEQLAWKEHESYWLKGIQQPQKIYEPYHTQLVQPLPDLAGKKATSEEEWLYCKRCGRLVKRTETFKCRTCGTQGICTTFCFQAEQRQCIECASKTSDMPCRAQKLIDLQNPKASFEIKVWTEYTTTRGSTRNMVVVPKREFGQYRLGDTVTAYFQSSVDAYVYMINIGPTGDITFIFPPNEYATDNRVKGGKQYTFPEQNAPFEWILQEPVGTETIKVIATKVPVDIDRFLDTQKSTATTRNIGVRPRYTENLHPDQWAEASCTLLVQQ